MESERLASDGDIVARICVEAGGLAGRGLVRTVAHGV